MVRIDNPRVALSLTLLMVIALLLPFVGLMGEAPLATDDPVLAAVALDMAGNPTFSIRLPDEYLTDLPPLYPVTAAMVAHATSPIIGDIAALRLTSALFGLGTLVLFYFFALRYGDRYFALLAVALLATMPGFAFGSGCITSGPALGFFLMASVLATSRAFFDGSPHWLLVGGVVTAGAFLTSAWDGAFLSGFIWAAGLTWFLATQRPDLSTGFRYLFFQLSAFLAIIVLSGAGIAFQFIGNPELPWNEGFWIPFSAAPTSPGIPDMVVRLLVLTWPWTPLFCLYMGLSIARTLRSGTIPATPIFLAVWVFSALITMLSGGTGITPILPPLALMSAFAFRGKLPEWVRHYATLWSSVVLASLLLLAFSPVLSPLAGKTGNEVLLRLLGYGSHTLIAAVGFLLAAFTCLVKTLPLTRTGRLLTITAILWAALSSGPFSAVAVEQGVEVQPLITALKTHPHKGTATFGVTRQLRASLCFYGQLDLPPLNNLERCYDILKGGDPEYDTLLIQSDSSGHLPDGLSLLPVTLVTELPLSQGGSLLWVKGR